MLDSRAIISRDYFKTQAPCIVSYPVADGFANIFITKDGDTFAYGYATTHMNLENLTNTHADQLISMFSGDIISVKTTQDIDFFRQEFLTDLEWMKNNLEHRHVPPKEEIEYIENLFLASIEKF
jgi:hypothetical protein